MPQLPILTSGKLMLARGEVEDPREPRDRRDWAQLVDVNVPPGEDEGMVRAYWGRGVQLFLATGDSRALDDFRGQRAGGYPLQTDPGLIEDWAQANPGFDPGELYQS